MKILVTISRIITGLVFTFSGFVKSVDPVGTQIKFGDYFDAMGLDVLSPYALVFSILLNAAELIIGLMLLFNIFSKLSSWSALFFLILFTPLTLWLAIANTVNDCGCFGDAVTLSNWQTFWKNIIFLTFVIILVGFGKKFKSQMNLKNSFSILFLFIILSFGFQFYNFYNLPIIDFRPFKVGVNIKDATSYPEDAERDVYETILYYKNLKTGKSKAFPIDSIPYKDTLTWTFETTVTNLVSKGYEPPIHDFFLTDLNGNDITQDILNEKDLSLIFVFHKINEEYNKVEDYLFELSEYSENNNLNVYCFTSSGSTEIESVIEKIPKNIIICTGDYKMLKTMIRSNPGFVILKDAVIIKKYHYKNIPEISEIENYK